MGRDVKKEVHRLLVCFCVEYTGRWIDANFQIKEDNGVVEVRGFPGETSKW